MRPISARSLALVGFGLLLLGFVALRVVATQRVAFNWDELVLFQSVVQSARDGVFRSGGRPGLVQLLLTPLLDACQDEIATGRQARLIWVGVTLLYLGGIAALLAELLRGSARRLHDVLLGVALLALVPAFLEWSIQVRTDQLALAGGVWGGAALLASQRRPSLALATGMCFGLGWLASQKLAYVAGLGVLLCALRLMRDGCAAAPRAGARGAGRRRRHRRVARVPHRADGTLRSGAGASRARRPAGAAGARAARRLRLLSRHARLEPVPRASCRRWSPTWRWPDCSRSPACDSCGAANATRACSPPGSCSRSASRSASSTPEPSPTSG